MNLSVGIVGLPNVGKSTLFNALLKRQIAQVGEYPYTTIEPNVGVVEVPDERLREISKAVNIPKKVPVAIEFIDIAGLIRGAHKGEGLGNQFLAKIREVDVIVHVVRAFENPNVEHVGGKIDPETDIKSVNEELKLGGITKPTIFVINASEQDLSTSLYYYNEVIDFVEKKYDSRPIIISAKLEAELSELSKEDQRAYLKELGIERSAIDQVIQESYQLLNLITFFTVAKGKQVQAWPIKKGKLAIEAAEIVHSDFAKGFIVAEVVDFQKLVDCTSWHAAKEKGFVKTLGKNEIIEDGQVVEFKFTQ